MHAEVAGEFCLLRDGAKKLTVNSCEATCPKAPYDI